MTEIAAGILKEDSTHLMTAHTSRGYCATDAYGDPKWLTVDTAYLSEKTLFRPMLLILPAAI